MFEVLLLGALGHLLPPPSSSSQHSRVAVSRFGAGRGKAASSLLTEGLKASPSYTPGCGAELWCLARPRSQRKPRHELLACRLPSLCRARSPPACLVLSCNQPVYCSEKVKLVREKKKKKDGFFFLPLSNESLGTFSLLTSESYPIAFAVRPDLQRTPWGKAKILVKPLKRKSTLRDDFLLLLCPDFTF